LLSFREGMLEPSRRSICSKSLTLFGSRNRESCLQCLPKNVEALRRDIGEEGAEREAPPTLLARTFIHSGIVLAILGFSLSLGVWGYEHYAYIT